MASDSLAKARHQSVTGANQTSQGNSMNLLEHLQPLPTELLNAMAKGEVDTQAIAARLMAERGLDKQGKWVGFEASAQVWGIRATA